MKKLFLLIASACMLIPAVSFAQVTRTEDDKTVTFVEETQTPEGKIVTTTVYEKNSVFTNGFWHNWTLGVDLGAQFYWGENDWKVAKWTEMVTFPAIDLYLTKWASPSFGVGLGATYGKFAGLYQTLTIPQSAQFAPIGNFQQDPVVYYTDADTKYDYQGLAVQKGQYVNVYALAHADLGNIFFGYKPDRFFDIDAYAGGGIILGFDKRAVVPSATFNCGLNNTFRLAERLRLIINLRGALVGDEFDGESFITEPTEKHWLANHKLDGIFGVTGGLQFNLGKEYSKWNLACRTSSLQKDVQTIEKLIEKEVPVEKEVIIRDVPEVWWHINFIVDRWDLLTRELVNLQAVSDLIKSTPHTKYLLCGYADKQTATPEHNMMLSKNRVEAVYNALVNQFGVNPDQLVTDYKGGVDYMFYNEKELSRCCMITSIKE